MTNQPTDEARKIAKEAIDGSDGWDDMEDRIAFSIDNVAHRRAQQARDAVLERVLDILAKYGDDESETYHQIYMLKSGALKSTASGDEE